MKYLLYLLSLFFSCLFTVGCTCDEPYCPHIEEVTIEINYSDDFSLTELRNSNLVIFDTVNQVTTDSYNLIGERSTNKKTSIYYSQYFFTNESPSMDNIFILNFDDFSDTIRNLRYEPNQTTYRCNVGCNFDRYRTVGFIELNNLYMTHRGDTIWDKTVFIEK